MIAETERSRIASASMSSRADGSAMYSRPQWTNATTAPVGVRAVKPVEQGRRQQVGLRRAVGVDVGQADDIEARQRQHVALAEPGDAGGVERRWWFRHSPKRPRSIAWLLARPTAATLSRFSHAVASSCGMASVMSSIASGTLGRMTPSRLTISGRDLVRARISLRDAVADLLVEQHLLHRAAEIRRRRQNSRFAHWRAAGRCSRARTCRTG